MKITLETKHLIAFLDRVVRATDNAEVHLDLIDRSDDPAISEAVGVLRTVRAANGEIRKFREELKLIEKDPDFVDLAKSGQEIYRCGFPRHLANPR
jgi:hypothetical protein